jgi:hypothetical protein
MSDESGDAQVSTSGTRTLAPGPLDAASIEYRLAALRETIRTWDWHASVLDAPAASVEEATPVLSNSKTAALAERREEQVPSSATTVAPDEARVHWEFIDEDPVRVDEVPSPPADILLASDERAQPVPWVVEPPPPFMTETQAVPVISETQAVPTPSEGGFGDIVDAPVKTSGPKHSAQGPFARMWAHPWTDLVALCLVVIVAVLVIVWGLRLAHKDPGSGSGPTAVTQTTTSQTAATTTRQATVAVPVTAAQLAQYQQYAGAFQTANTAAKTGLARAGTSPTLTQVTPVMANYLTALKLYNLQVHFVQWPASMQADVATDEAQLAALMNFVPSAANVGATGMGTWLSQLHAQAATLQTADNKIHQDLGLPASSILP